MKKRLPKISVIIPVRPQGEVEATIAALEGINYPSVLVEVLVAYGLSPSRQRNQACQKAKGEILYFLDNDAEIEKQAFKRMVAVFSGRVVSLEKPQFRGFSLLPSWFCHLIVKKFFSGTVYRGEIGVVGGPNIWWRKESFWASMAGVVLESFFAHYLMAARYRPVGPIHQATEKELILCNLAVRRDVFKKVGGFNEILYPNEENELLNRIRKAGYQLVYHPGILAFRPRRETLKDLLTAFHHYGRGRMEQIRVEGIWQNISLLAPLFFLFYLSFLIFFHPWFAFLPLILYFGLGLGSALGFAVRRKKPYLALFLPLLFLIVHLNYALGLIYGLLTNLEEIRRQKKRGKIKIIKMKRFGKGWA